MAQFATKKFEEREATKAEAARRDGEAKEAARQEREDAEAVRAAIAARLLAQADATKASNWQQNQKL